MKLQSPHFLSLSKHHHVPNEGHSIFIDRHSASIEAGKYEVFGVSAVLKDGLVRFGGRGVVGVELKLGVRLLVSQLYRYGMGPSRKLYHKASNLPPSLEFNVSARSLG